MAVTYQNAANGASARVLANCFYVPPVQREVSGYTLDGGYAKGTVVPMGTPICASTETKTAKVCKYAVVERKVDAKNFILRDLGFLEAGDKFFISEAENPSLYTIASVDKATNTITLSANNAVLKAGDIIVEGKQVEAEGSDAEAYIAPVNIPNRIVSHTATLAEYDKTVSGTYAGVAIQNVLRYPAEYLNRTAFPGSILLAGCPTIHFVKI